MSHSCLGVVLGEGFTYMEIQREVGLGVVLGERFTYMAIQREVGLGVVSQLSVFHHTLELYTHTHTRTHTLYMVKNLIWCLTGVTQVKNFKLNTHSIKSHGSGIPSIEIKQ